MKTGQTICDRILRENEKKEFLKENGKLQKYNVNDKNRNAKQNKKGKLIFLEESLI